MRAAKAHREEPTLTYRGGVDRLMPAPTSKREDDEQQNRVSRQEEEHSEERCKYRLLSVIPVVSLRVEGGYVGRCLLCRTTGPIRADGEAARCALLEQIRSNEGRRMACSRKVVSIYRDA